MKKLLLLIFISQQVLGQSVSKKSLKTVDSLAIYNKRLTAREMKNDLELFRNIREKANSGLYRYRTSTQIDSIYKSALKQIKKPLTITEFYKIILTLTDFEGSVHNYTEAGTQLLDFLNRQRGFFP